MAEGGNFMAITDAGGPDFSTDVQKGQGGETKFAGPTVYLHHHFQNFKV